MEPSVRERPRASESVRERPTAREGAAVLRSFFLGRPWQSQWIPQRRLSIGPKMRTGHVLIHGTGACAHGQVKPEKSEKEMAMVRRRVCTARGFGPRPSQEPPAPPTPFQEGLATPVRPSHAPNTPEAMCFFESHSKRKETSIFLFHEFFCFS